jgi:hypothetical protein
VTLLLLLLLLLLRQRVILLLQGLQLQLEGRCFSFSGCCCFTGNRSTFSRCSRRRGIIGRLAR